MGNSVGRPSCLGEKSPRAEDDFPKEPRSAAPKNHPRDEAEAESAGAPEKAALLRPGVMENGWSMALEGATKGSPLPKQSNLDFQLQSQPEGDTWASPESLGPSWGWRLQTAREVKEVTEVTETVVTEIVEVTKHPNGDENREALMARTEAAAPPGGKQGAGLSLEAAGKLGAWIVEVEDLMGHQKPPAGEAKVVEAQLQEQKLLLRLLEERTPHISPLCQPLSAGPASAAEGEEQPKGLDSLQEKWAALVQEAEARHSRLQQIVPAAGLFQESAEAFQDWLSLTEQKLAQLWGGPGSLNALQQIQDLRREVQSKPDQLEDALERGRRLSQMVPGEEGQLVRGQMDSLRLRLLLVDQRSSDTLQRMEQTLGASSCLDPAQDHLQPPEEEQLLPGSQATDRPCPRAPAGGEKVRGSWQLLLKWMERAGAACPTPTGAPPAKQEDLEALLGQHEEFQRRLWAKHPIFGATLQQGGLLCGKALLPADGQELDAMQRELKEHWGPLWSWAAERQQKVEEQLLFSSRLGDALQGLLDWLCRAESQLAEATPVPGDRDLVGTLMEQHKAFQTELGRRAVAVRTLRCSAHVLAPGRSSEDARWLQIQMEELGDPWDLIGRLSICQQDRLEVALRQAEEFHHLMRALLSPLPGLEKSAVGGAPGAQEGEVDVAEGQNQLEVREGPGGPCCSPPEESHDWASSLQPPFWSGGLAPQGGAAGLAHHQQEAQQSVPCRQLELDCIRSLGEEILNACHPEAVGTVRSWVTLAKSRFQQLCNRVQQQEPQWPAQGETEQLSDWITAAEEALRLQDQEPLPEDARQLEVLGCQHRVFMRELDHKQAEVEKVAKRGRQERRAPLASSCPGPPGWPGASRALPWPSCLSLEGLDTQNPLPAQLAHRWQRLWLAAQDRHHQLQSSQQRHQQLEETAGFDFAAWRKRYLQWIGHRKSQLLDIFRSIDQGQDGRITQQEFVGCVLASKFPTSLSEMKAVARTFDVNRDGCVDYHEFISALHPSRDILRRAASVDHIQEEVNRQVAECNCVKRFQVEQISATRYRFGECRQLRMVRILRSTLMVRVGGGWTALDEFLVKNDPCRVKGRTNLKINEKYLCPGLPGRKGAGSQSAPASKHHSPGCSTSSLGLYSSASLPSSPIVRKTVLHRTRSGDRCPHSSRPAGATGGPEVASAAGATGPDAEPPGHPRREAAPSDVPAP